MTSAEVAALREDLGWSRAEMARFLGVAALTVTRWEDGRSPPTGTSRAVLDAIREALNTAPAFAHTQLQRGRRLGGLGVLLVVRIREVIG